MILVNITVHSTVSPQEICKVLHMIVRIIFFGVHNESTRVDYSNEITMTDEYHNGSHADIMFKAMHVHDKAPNKGSEGMPTPSHSNNI